MKYRPYKTDAANVIYNLLFCDDLELYENTFKGERISPWDVLFSSSSSNNDLEKIINDSKCESRVRILAYNKLAKLGVRPQRKELLGIIVEVGMREGLDTLAVYADKSIRYINYTGKMIIREPAEDVQINTKITELFQKSAQVISNIGPWDKERLAPPQRQIVRITFLVSDGLYFGQGKWNAFSKDPIGGPAINAATELMNLVVSTTLDHAN